MSLTLALDTDRATDILKKIIHVNRQHMIMNVKDGGERPTLTAKTYKQNVKGSRVDILDKDGNVVASLLDSQQCGLKQKACGARIWIETELAIAVDGLVIP